MQVKYEVQEFTLCDGWINNWSFTDDDGQTKQSLFDTRESAEWALIDFIEDCNTEVEEGNMPDAPEYSDYKIVEVQL